MTGNNHTSNGQRCSENVCKNKKRIRDLNRQDLFARPQNRVKNQEMYIVGDALMETINKRTN